MERVRLSGIGPRLWRSPAAAATPFALAPMFRVAIRSDARLGFATAAVRLRLQPRCVHWHAFYDSSYAHGFARNDNTGFAQEFNLPKAHACTIETILSYSALPE